MYNRIYTNFGRKIMSQNKVPKGYYIVSIIFILVTLRNFSYVDGEGQILVDLGLYNTYLSDVGLALCKAYIYTISIYGLINNTKWGLVSTTLIAFWIGIIHLRDLLQYGDTVFAVGTVIFLGIFAYLVSIMWKKIKEIIND